VFFTNIIDFSGATTMQPENTKIKINLTQLLDGQTLVVFIADFSQAAMLQG